MIIPQKSTNNPFWTPAGDLPVLRHAGVVLTDFNSIARHLRACNYSADYNLPPKQVEKFYLGSVVQSHQFQGGRGKCIYPTYGREAGTCFKVDI